MVHPADHHRADVQSAIGLVAVPDEIVPIGDVDGAVGCGGVGDDVARGIRHPDDVGLTKGLNPAGEEGGEVGPALVALDAVHDARQDRVDLVDGAAGMLGERVAQGLEGVPVVVQDGVPGPQDLPAADRQDGDGRDERDGRRGAQDVSQ